MADDAGIPALQEAIRHLHGCESTFVECVPVTVRLLGRTLWDGEVSVFDLPPGSPSTRCYAWSHETNGTARHFVAILHVPHAESPVEAVQQYLVKAARKTKTSHMAP